MIHNDKQIGMKIDESPCCDEIIWDENGNLHTWTRTEAINEEYHVYQTQRNGETIYMWWMWHDSVGHWVINKTPGQHGHDILKICLEI